MPTFVSPATDDRLPLYQRLRDALAAKVADRVWQPGGALPSELSLAKSYGVSPGTMRKAIESLVDEGLLERRQGKGTFVRRASFNHSLFRFFRFQRGGGERVVPEGRILSREVVPAPPEIAGKLALEAGTPAIRMARLRLFDGRPGLAEDIWLPLDRFAAFLDEPAERIGDLLYPVYESLCGQVIACAEEDLTAEAADPRHAELLGIAPGTSVIVIERLAFGFDNEPLEWRRSRGRAEQFHYHIEIR